LREQAREFALAYDADKVTQEYWVPALADLEKTLKPANRASAIPPPKGDAPQIFRNQPKKRKARAAR
jgi:hypothetical protein